MAPSVADIKAATESVVDSVAQLKIANNTPAAPVESEITDSGPSYPGYVPYFDREEKFPPLEIFEHSDPGLLANPAKPNLLTENAKVSHISPYLGTEVRGVQLSQLSKDGLNELALYVAERKVVIFRDQDFKDLGFDRQIEIARHYGPIHRHPTSGNVKGYPEFHVVYRDSKENRFKDYRGGNNLSSLQWHSDVTYEKQPPSTTFFFIFDQPTVGGDTLFASQVEAYKRLSPKFQKRLEGLKALHSAVYQADFSRQRDGPVRREPVETEHPVVRVHPVTGEKALFVNEGFTRSIVGFKKEESDFLLKFLIDHIAKGADFQIRARYEPGTVVVWDNRLVVHSVNPDYGPEFRRHAVRLTPQAEVPIAATA
ncbi:alpha-ketoglutarate-dependent taurine dioxygenase [Ephemerocybe angulata]|uniref:Alpha-ketoglutarate-dependent taurine dioxygenase n=1 Tax=Ephemerocybe angulata TaxID=980116 RepID=A0A8H6HRW2_9AGAR|nr:alpha-ketoglutarate-dependent taurine dioxygenase [Tulosesus angulatus]